MGRGTAELPEEVAGWIPTVRRVQVYHVADGQPLGRLTETFPGLEHLVLYPESSGGSAIDLRELSGSHRLHVHIGGLNAAEAPLLGTELFPPGRLTIA